MMQFPWEKEIRCFLWELASEDNRAVCQKGGN